MIAHPARVESLVDIMHLWAGQTPDRRAFTFLADGEVEQDHLTYGELESRARLIGARLMQCCRRGETALLLYPPGLEFIAAFFACLTVGVVAVPAYPPRQRRLPQRLLSIIADARPRAILTSSALLPRFSELSSRLVDFGNASLIATDTLPDEGGWEGPCPHGDEIAFLQYTSGSTSTPKGVMVSHGNLIHNMRVLEAACEQSSASVFVSWLPLYHDMGLIGNILHPLYLGASCVLMAPMAFLQRPLRWLRAMSHYRATTSGGPNFAYDLCVRQIDEAARAELDLASWSVAFNGAEPVQAETLDRFFASFGPCGLRREALYPCYGLAEATLFVSGGRRGEPARLLGVDGAALEQGRLAPVGAGRAPDSRMPRLLVSCGRPQLEQEVAIVDPATGVRCPPGQVGEIWVAGGSVAQGYWRREPETRAVFGAFLEGRGPFLRTGDLGAIEGGDLFVTGRLKDLIIIRGRNLYPQDVEALVERSHPALRPGCCGAFTFLADGEERLVVVQEIERRREAEAVEAATAIRRDVADELDVQLHEVLVLRAGTVPKTSSGKIQRHACREGYLAGTLTVIAADAPAAALPAPVLPAPSRGELASLSEEDRTAALLDFLIREVAEVARVSAARVDPASPLSHLGFDSLMAVEIEHRVEAGLGIELSLAAILEAPSLIDLARELSTRLGGEQIARHGTAEPAAEISLSRGQRGLWFLERLASESAVFNLAAAAQIGHEVDAAALDSAIRSLALRHPALRTTFHTVAGEPVQRVGDGRGIELRVEPLSAGRDGDGLAARLAAEAHRPFDLENGPLFRATLFTGLAPGAVLLLAAHHLIADFQSLEIAVRDLGALYEQELSGVPAALPPIRASYADHVLGERDRLARKGEELWSFWRDELSGNLPPLDLPTDRPRPPVQTHRGAVRFSRLKGERAGRIAVAGRERGATVFMTLLAAYEVLLSRYAGQQDLLVGSPAAGRASAGLAEVVGYFVNPVVIRTDLDGDPTLAELLERVRRRVLAALEHRDYPFPLLVERLAPVRDPSRSPLVQAMFLLHRARRPEDETLAAFALGQGGGVFRSGRLSLAPLEIAEPRSQVDLSLSVAQVGEEIAAALLFNADLFDGSTARRMLEHWETVLGALAEEPGRRLSQVSLLSAVQRQQVILEWNDTGLELPAGPAVHHPIEQRARLQPGTPAETCCLHELFEAQVARTPDATALIAGDLRWTYDALNRRANRLAHHLRRLGVGPEQRVGVSMSRSAELVAALLAVLKAGAAYVPLDPAYPAGWRSFAAVDARLSLLLTEAAAEEGSGDPEQNPEPLAGPRNLAYVLYTSGSTGRPKGVAIEHRSPVERMLWARDAFPAADLAGVLAATSACFDLSVFEIFAPLSWGGTVILADHALALPALPARGEVTLLNTVPSAMAELAAGPLPPRLRTVNLAGEALAPELAERIYRHAQVEQVLNLYGPTEDATYSTWMRVGRGTTRVSIGRPLPGTRAYVLDRHLQPAPGGVPGELYLAGVGGARGYLGRPELTAERFLPDPFAAQPGGRLYRTGDLARRLAAGELEHLGRTDHQVKVRGFRIELGEIERVLCEHPEVLEAAVMVWDSPGGRALAAYVAPGEIGVEELRRHLGGRLPAYMVPSSFQRLPSLPRTPNGKLDRKALSAPQGQAAEATYRAPQTPVEEVLAGTWADVLGRERVGLDDHFFDLGGHSLLATQVTSRLWSDLGVEIPLRDLFAAPTLAGLSARVEAALRSGAGRHAPPLVAVPREGPLPASFAQQRLWFIAQLEPDSPLYNMPGALRVTGPLDAAVLALCLGEIVRRHEALRTVFATQDDGSLVQVIRPVSLVPLPVIDLAGLGEKTREAHAFVLTAEEAARPFDLARGPLLRVTLLRLGAEDHLLLLTVHHVVADGWSLGILVRELTVLYPVFAERRPSPLPELPVQYADFSAWQRSWLSGEVLEQEIAWWRSQLASLPGLLELPTDRARPAVASHRGDTRPLYLPADLVRQAEALARREGATPFMVFLATFQALLARYSGQDDLAVGTPVAGRNRVEIEGLIGFFVNALVLRGDLTGAPTFRELLGRVRETTLAAHAHQGLSFEKLVEELAPERSLAHAPLFQVMLALQNTTVESLRIEGLRLQPVEVQGTTAKFDLTVHLAASVGGLAGSIEYATDLFDAAMVDRLADHFVRLLTAAVADPDQPAAALPLLDAAERHLLLAEWNDTGIELPADPAVHNLFLRQARLQPEAPALCFGPEAVDYGELDRRSAGLARRLRRLGVGPEVRVGLFLERSVDLVVGLLGVLRSGGAYVPLDPQHPEKRLAYVLEDSGATVLLTQRSHRDRFPGFTGSVVLVDADGGADGRDADEELPAVAGDSLAYVIYTSGSTGRPKGVQVTHRGVVNFLTAMMELGSLGPGDTLLSVTTVSFDIAVLEIFLPLAVGGRIALADGETASDGRLLAAALDRSEATAMQGTPASWRLLLAAGWEGRPGLKGFCGGEALPRELALQLLARTGSLWNLYGPTETTVWSTVQPLPADVEQILVGRPIANTTIAIIGPGGELAPPGVVGELAIGGAGVARGYFGRPDLTAEKFVPDSWGEPGARFYRTGDLARRLADGRIDLLGRIDHQVKIRGFRIELGEIESTLAAHPGVADCAVLARQAAGGQQTLAAYVVPAGTSAPTAAELRRFLGSNLPAYMVPAIFVTLAALPLAPNGKVDRKALPVPERQRSEKSLLEPRTPAEEIIAGIWAEVLGLERVGRGDEFFSLGGHSLLATRVMSRLRDAFDVEMPLRELFETPRLEDFAARVEAVRGAGAGRATPPLLPMSTGLREGPLPLSFAQQRLWLIDQLEPGGPLYNIPAALRIEGPLRPAVLAASLGEIVRRHEALRTVFASPDGSPVQVIRPAERFALPVVDLSGLPEDEREARALVLAGEEAGRPFDLGRGPLVRGMLLRLAGKRHIFSLTLHHIVSDGWSMGLLVRELGALYAALAEGRPSPLGELPVQYADFAAWQRSWLCGEVLESEISFWRRQLEGLPPRLELPTDRPRPAVQSFRGASQHARLPVELTRQVQTLSRREGATPFMVLLAGFQALLARHSGQQDLAVGTPVAGRHQVDIEGLIGFFVNTLVLRAWLAGGEAGTQTLRELLGQVRETALAAHAHQDVPFEKLVQELSPERSLAQTPLFQVMFSLENFPLEGIELPDLELSLVALETATAKFDLELICTEEREGLSTRFLFASDLFDPSTIRRMAGHLAALLEGATADPDRRLSGLSLLSEAERHQLRAEWNDTAVPAGPGVVEILEAQARRTPEAPAVALADGEGGGLTYLQLDTRADRLAGRLRALGVGREVPVGLCIDTGPELAVAVLGILKSGAYLPLDPAHPRARLAFLLEDAGARVLVTQSHLLPALPPHGAQTVLLDRLESEETAETGAGKGRLPAPGDLAYLIYTSGTTGRPKAVQVEHGTLAATLAATQGLFRFAAGDRMPCLALSTFDISLFELLSPLLAGGTAVLFPLRPTLDVERLVDALGKLTCLHAVPALMREIVEALRRRGAAAPDVGKMRAVFTGGDAVPADLLDDLRQTFPAARVWVLYGPTEATIVCAAHPVPPAPAPAQPLLGRPLAGAVLEVRDAHGELQPAGVPGELWIGGAGVTRGYLGQEELTAERYVLCEGQRFYRSGDLVRRLADGTLEFLGRLDQQVKVKGFRIEPGEIERVLQEHPGVLQAAVIARSDGPAGQRQLVAYTVAASAPPPAAADLRGFLAERLPAYMVPGAFVVLDALPLNPNGKVDRSALPAPASHRAERAGLGVRGTPAEQILAEIWAQVLGVEQVDIHDNFFALGGDSILSIQVIVRAAAAGLRLSPRQLFQHQTVAELARVAAEAPAAAPAQGPVTGPVPLTPIQRWFFAESFADPHHWNQPLLLTVPEDAAPDALAAALTAIAAHHEALSLRFWRDETGWQQAVTTPSPAVGVLCCDLSALPVDRRNAALEDAGGAAQASLDLGGPLLRAVCFRLGARARLLLAVHHLVVDGVSWRILLQDLVTACAQIRRGEPVRLPPRTSSFQEWAQRLAEHAGSAELARELDGWRSLPGRPVSPLPVDFARRHLPAREGSARTVVAELDAAVTRPLLTTAHEAYRTQINDLLLTALGLALAEWTGQRTARIDLEGHGREDLFPDIDLSRTVGWFTTVFPVVLAVPGGGAGEALKAVKEQLRKIPRRGIGFGLLRYLAGEEAQAALAALPPAEVRFNYLGRIEPGGDGFGLAPEPAGPGRSPRAARSHLLEVDGMVAGERLVLHWTYSEELHRRETIERLARGFTRALEELVSHCLSPQAGAYTPSDFPLARVAQPVLDRLPRRQVEDLYPLSPLQEGMLFHTLLAPGQYFVQLVLELRGPLAPEILRQAWEAVVARHPALRTWFLHRDTEEPLQVVATRVPLAWETADWSGLEAGEQRDRLDASLAADRSRGFDLEAAPLLRLLLVRTSQQTHQLVWSLHHLLIDGWSVPIVLREVLVTYEALRAGVAPEVPVRRPFRDYIAWLAGQDAAASEELWRRHLAGLTAPRPLLASHGRGSEPPAADGYGEQDLVLPAAGTEALRALARRNQLTLGTVLQGAWAILLGRVSGEEDVVFGSTVSGRPTDLAAAGEMVGMFINTVPVWARMSRGEALVPWLQRFQDAQAELRQHEHTPLVQVQGWSAVPRDLPLFETLLVIENYPLDPGALAAGLSFQIGAVRSCEQTNYPLTVFVAPGADLHVHAVYQRGSFESAAVARLLGRLGTLLRALPDPAAAYDRLPLMEEAERQQVLVEWNDTLAAYPSAACVHELFLARVRQAADAMALVCDGECLTYGELAQRAEALAAQLAGLGVGPEVAVGLCVERGPALVVGMLGVLLAGGLYLPLDPAHPESRLAYALQDSGAAVLLTDGSTAGRFADFTGAVVRLDEPRVRPAAAAPRAGRPGPGNAAYAIYTSGSTGRPKGVVVTHRGVTNFLAAMAASTGIGAADVLAGVTTISFDIAVLEILLPLTTGGQVALLRGEETRDGRRLDAAVAAHGATALQATPATWRLLADAGWEGRADLRILCGGEALPADLAAFLLPRGAGLWNLYGPTETTVWSAVERVAPDRSVSVGRPIGNTRIVIVERGGEPAPLSVPGELCIGGTGVARGYLGRPDLTAERFVPDAWGEPGGRLYRTGDLARLAPDGRIDFLGRTDHQVKVRGFRIELQEVEAALEAYPQVREAAAAVRRRQPGAEAVLVAYVTVEPGGPQAAELRRFLGERLPSYMVPAQVVFLDALPRTLNRKLDRAALPEPAWNEPVRPAADLEPQSPVERLLAGLWSEVLGVASVGRHDGFFDLGGHSLFAGRILARVREIFRADVPLRAVFERPTLAGWAEAIEAALRGGAACEEAIPRAEREGPVPASSAQQRLWFIDRFEPESPVYNIPLAIELEGDLQPAVLCAALAGVIARHESLRTTFAEHDGQVVQVGRPAVDVTPPVVDLAALDGTAAGRESRRLTAQEAERPFDLVRGPLLRPVLLRLGERRHALLLTLHHIVGDGWSVVILVRELAHLYEALLAGELPSLPQPDLQYADYAVWQRRRLEQGQLEPELAFWRRRLAGAPAVLELPADRPRPAVQSFRGTRLPLALEDALAEGISTLGRSHRATVFMVLLAGFKALLSRLAGSTDVVVGSLVANRTRPETAGVIGVFVNTQVLRTRLDGNPGFREILGRVRETVLEAYAHQDLPFEELVAALAPQRDLSRTPLFQIAFAHQDAPLAKATVRGLTWQPLEIDTRVSRFDLGIDIFEGGGRLRGEIEHSTDLFDAATVLRLAGQYRQLLAACAADPDAGLSEIPLLSAVERHQLLVEWNDTALTAAPAARVPDLLAEQADRTPDAVAVIDGEARLTYRGLEARTNRLARYLRRRGVRPGVLVGIALERSLDLVTAVLGVLKAGGAYVPLDPAYPSQRLDFMLDDSGVAFLVTARGVLPTLAAHRMEIVSLDVDGPRIAGERAEPLPGAGGGEELAYVIYTSGSTGRPKGVAVPHRGLLNVAGVQRRCFGLGPGQRVLQFSSINFDISVFEILLALGSGATLVLAPHDAIAAVAGLSELLRRHEVTVIVLPPSVLATLSAGELPAIQRVVVGGEACSADLLARWARGRQFWNGYGPTETTIWTTLARCQANGRRPPIGRPIAGMRVYMVTAACAPVPVGVPGELLAGGVGVAWGYLGRPDLTAERFVPDPFGGEPGGRLYRTGDLVRELADGTLEFLGRIDHQVKVRGFRIELGEIETALGELPGIREAVVVVREDRPGDRRLVAYLVATDGRRLDPGELRLAIKDRLPDSMVPSAFVQLDALPLTPSAKVDRQALPAPDVERPAAPGTYTAPRNHVEAVLARVWSEVLGVREVGVDDNFFTLGGDSILSLRVVARAGEAGVRVSARQLFEHQTIGELAAVASSGAAIIAEQEPVIGEVPLTPIQTWFFDQDFPAPEHWNQSLLLTTRPGTDAGLLEQVLSHLVLHHDALRLRFERDAAGWRQHSVGCEPLGLLRCDLSQIPADRRSAAIAQVAVWLHASLDLAAGPLVRACHLVCGAEPGRLLLIAHHLVVDGVSWRILLSDLVAGYAQLRQGESLRLPPKTTSFRQWAQLLAERAGSEGLAEELAFWRSEAALLPPGSPAIPAGTEEEAQRLSASLTTGETDLLLHEAPVAYDATVLELLLAACARAFWSTTGSTALVVDLEGHGRESLSTQMDLSRTVGWFTTVFPFALAGGDRDARSTVAAARRLRSVPHHGIGFGLLRHLAPDPRIRGELRRLERAEVSFNYLGQVDEAFPGDAPFGLAPEPSGPHRAPGGERTHAVEILCAVASGRLQIEIAASAGREAHKFLDAWLEAIRWLLDSRLDEPSAPASEYLPELGFTSEEIDALMAKYGLSEAYDL